MLLPSSSARSSSSPRSTRICDFGHAQSQSLTLLICAAANSWAFIRCMEERFGLCMESGLCQRMDLRSKHLDSMQWRVSMAAVELNYPVDFSKIMEFEGFGRRAKVTSQSSQSHQHLAMMIIDDNIKNGLKETVENDLSSNFSLLQYLKFMARWEQKKSVGGGKKKEVKETGLDLSFTKDENFKEWYFEVAVNDEMIEYNDISSYYILRPWAISKLPLFVSPSVLQKEKDHIEGFAPEMRTKVLGTIGLVECASAWNC
ncbi:Uncharacterized protein TCM_020371 [Theobroma cacao]|uniref:Uncharacterized protein n=1 Tax=Theobroma cacao TaxID=3641 RepID=A0A061EL03_THECC|nr:Uncharacterized protein TCM_020371 [Theobroma cacao]